MGLLTGLIVTGTDMPSSLLPGFLIKSDLGSRAWIRIGVRLVRDSDPHSQLEQTSNHRDMDSQYATVDQLAEITDTMASLWDWDRGLMGIRPNHCQFRGAPRMTLPHLHHHPHHMDPQYSRTTQFHLYHPHHYLDPLYSKTIQFHLHHHHWFNQPRKLELLFYMVRLRPYHILL